MECKYNRNIEDYLLHKLNKAECNAFEEHLFACASCRNELDTQRNIIALVQQQDDTSLTAYIHQPRQYKRRKQWWMAAAALAILLTSSSVTLLLTRHQKAPELAEQKQQPAADSTLLIQLQSENKALKNRLQEQTKALIQQRNNLLVYASFDVPAYTSVATRSELSTFDHAMQQFTAGHYAKAIDLFDQAVKDLQIDGDLVFYYGISCLTLCLQGEEENTELWNKAKDYLSAHAHDEQSTYQHQAQWHLALIYLHDNNVDHAIMWLQKVRKEDKEKSAEASKLLQILEKQKIDTSLPGIE